MGYVDDTAIDWPTYGYKHDFPEGTDRWLYAGENDEVTRGVTIGSSSSAQTFEGAKCDYGSSSYPEEDAFSGLPMYAGDFYREPDDVTRGVTMGPVDLQDLSNDWAYPSALGFDQNWSSPFPGKIDSIGGAKFEANRQFTERFQESDEPPNAPDDEYFEFERSTLFLTSSRPSDTGNLLLDFLDTQVISKIAKVSRKKFAIKAEVFVGGGSMSKLKVRMYRQEEGRYAVQFQRRGGSATTFNDAYKLASEFLSLSSDSKVKSGKENRDPTREGQKPPSLIPVEELDMTPMLEMATLSEQPSLQAEAALALADAAQDDRVAASLCTSQAFEESALKLLESDRMDISYPTARLLLTLAKCPRAEAAFANSAIAPIIEKKAQSESNKCVQDLLAQALSTMRTSCTNTLLENTVVPETKLAFDLAKMSEAICQ
eukprot:gnl/TRDRNA2_/TRDRNA2_47643_c0_seq1.p1 gnl/TRDRNA2_/TRDRNA2_47643_c0~~gnl/TRDRNA2_/TRDRNA2_47643_c0_seq1.p1  ORF type:complete len:498 (-),score=87.19 gnl/TRDRNA2_/TRDRNA2_47643_c0_seq1:136-1422(-)